MRWNEQARAVTVCFGLVGLFSVFSVRLIDLQILQHEKFTALAAEKHNHKQIIYARRGIIRDAHNEPLAENIPVKTVVADASHIRDPGAVAAAIADKLEMDPRDLADKLSQSGKGSKHIVLRTEIPEETAQKIRESLWTANLRGIYFDQDFVRVYPNGQMLSQVIGFVDHEHKGTMGVERTMQDFLQGADGFRYIETDRTGKELVPYRGQESPAKDGCDVKLTVDLGLQNIVEFELDAACAEFKPKNATAIMMRPQTGEILAMASRPSFDPNKPGDASPDQEKNRSVVDMVEPGSTFKIVTTNVGCPRRETGDAGYDDILREWTFSVRGARLEGCAPDGGFDSAPGIDEIEQHRRRQTGTAAWRSEAVRVRPTIRVWTENRRHLKRRDLRSG